MAFSRHFVVLLQKRDGNNVVTLLYGGRVVEKAMVGGSFFSFNFFFFNGAFGLVHYNEMVVLFFC
jgi:hypothetical protein